MSDKRRHRGPHPEDRRLFADGMLPALREAVAHYSWLLSRGYASRSSIKIVGDRFALIDRQRVAVMRCGCADASLDARRTRETQSVAGRTIALDGYNVLTTVEAALSGGVALTGRDGCFRDMASMHGHYKKVEETVPAIRMIGATLAGLRPGETTWYLDRPVSNSGRLRQMLLDSAAECGWSWCVEMVPDPDPVLMKLHGAVATADSAILNECGSWFNLARFVIRDHAPLAWVVDLAADGNAASQARKIGV